LESEQTTSFGSESIPHWSFVQEYIYAGLVMAVPWPKNKTGQREAGLFFNFEWN
jgi:hypothetical protein